jgi:FMN phosphatase YigB (HAD superfamily)
LCNDLNDITNREILMNRSRAKAILFDFGGTLDSDGVPWNERFYRLYREVGVDWDLRSFEEFYYASDDSLTAEKLDAVGYEAMLLEQVKRVLSNGGSYDSLLARRISNRFYADSLDCLDRNKDLLRVLAERYRLGMVSNFYGNLEFLCGEIGYDRFFTAVIDSARVGMTKPHPGIFLAALERLGCEPGQAVFVGDNPVRDMGGARALAMPHVWLNGLQTNREPCCEGDPVIRSLAELRGILL